MSINYTTARVHNKTSRTVNANWQTVTNYSQPRDPNSFQRVLLKANGTVTAMLEAYLSEPIQVVKLSESLTKMKLELPDLQSDKEEPVIVRKVLLQGKNSQCNFIYADSLILINNLDKRFSNSLLSTKTPIGKLWTEHKVETYKEIIDSGIEPANQLAKHFDIESQENLLFRTYAVYSQGKVTMIITEKFPERDFASQIPLAS